MSEVLVGRLGKGYEAIERIGQLTLVPLDQPAPPVPPEGEPPEADMLGAHFRVLRTAIATALDRPDPPERAILIRAMDAIGQLGAGQQQMVSDLRETLAGLTAALQMRQEPAVVHVPPPASDPRLAEVVSALNALAEALARPAEPPVVNIPVTPVDVKVSVEMPDEVTEMTVTDRDSEGRLRRTVTQRLRTPRE